MHSIFAVTVEDAYRTLTTSLSNSVYIRMIEHYESLLNNTIEKQQMVEC